MKAAYGWIAALALTTLCACESKQDTPVEPQAQAPEPAALTKAPEAAPEKPKSHVRLSNVKTLVPLEKIDSKKVKAPQQVPIGDPKESNESTAP